MTDIEELTKSYEDILQALVEELMLYGAKNDELEARIKNTVEYIYEEYDKLDAPLHVLVVVNNILKKLKGETDE